MAVNFEQSRVKDEVTSLNRFPVRLFAAVQLEGKLPEKHDFRNAAFGNTSGKLSQGKGMPMVGGYLD